MESNRPRGGEVKRTIEALQVAVLTLLILLGSGLALGIVVGVTMWVVRSINQ